jgi:hypothetical protein
MTTPEYYETIPVLNESAIFNKRVPFEGFSMSIMENPKQPNTFIGIMCQIETFSSESKASDYTTHESHLTPYYYHRNYIVEFDNQFNVLTSEELQEGTRTLSRTTTNGCKDIRVIPNGHFMTASTRYALNQWRPEMCFCTIDYEQALITSVKPLKYYATTKRQQEERSQRTQEDWLVLKHLERQEQLYVIQSYNPLRIISVHTRSAEATLVSMKTVFQVDECDVRGGACVYLPHVKLYLVAVSVHHRNKYLFSHWITLNSLYTYTGISDRFRYQPFESVNSIEKCTSIVVQEDTNSIICTVSINDNYVMLYEFQLDKILETIKD